LLKGIKNSKEESRKNTHYGYNKNQLDQGKAI